VLALSCLCAWSNLPSMYRFSLNFVMGDSAKICKEIVRLLLMSKITGTVHEDLSQYIISH
jgi:hypothetical protein